MVVFAVVIASLMLLYVDAACPPTWHSYRSSCYYVSLRELGSWPEAEIFCRVLGGYLVDINDISEDNFVRGLARSGKADHVWIGATDIEQENVWTSSHTQKPLEYRGTWGPGQPDHDGNCLVIWRDSNYLWGDQNCHVRFNFICEKPAL